MSRPHRANRHQHTLLWRMVHGAVQSALHAHPDYLTAKGHATAAESITKRVVGQLAGYANQTRKGGPVSASGPRVQTGDFPVARGGGGCVPRRQRATPCPPPVPAAAPLPQRLALRILPFALLALAGAVAIRVLA